MELQAFLSNFTDLHIVAMWVTVLCFIAFMYRAISKLSNLNHKELALKTRLRELDGKLLKLKSDKVLTKRGATCEYIRTNPSLLRNW